MRLIYLGHDFYIAKFQYEEDFLRSIAGGPWFINDQYLTVHICNRSLIPKQQAPLLQQSWSASRDYRWNSITVSYWKGLEMQSENWSRCICTLLIAKGLACSHLHPSRYQHSPNSRCSNRNQTCAVDTIRGLYVCFTSGCMGHMEIECPTKEPPLPSKEDKGKKIMVKEESFVKDELGAWNTVTPEFWSPATYQQSGGNQASTSNHKVIIRILISIACTI